MAMSAAPDLSFGSHLTCLSSKPGDGLSGLLYKAMLIREEGVIFRLAGRLEGAQARRSHLSRRLQGLLAMAAGRREFVRSNLQGCTKPPNVLCCVYGGAQVTSCKGQSTREARVVDQNQPSRPKAPIA